MKWLMKLLGINPDLAHVKDEATRRAFQMDDAQKLERLRQFCHAYGNSDFTGCDVISLDQDVRGIGAMLHERGGVEEMQRFIDPLGSVTGIRSLELSWQGIGEWQAWIPACDLPEASNDQEGVLRAKIRVDGSVVDAEFFDGVICTGEERDDQIGNFDISIRVAQRIPVFEFLENCEVQLPWGPKHERFYSCASCPIPDGFTNSLVTDSTAPWLDDRTHVPEFAEVFWSANGDEPIGQLKIRAEP